MGLIADLIATLRPKADGGPRSISEVEAALTRLSSERSAADAAFKAAHRRRGELIDSDASDEEIRAIEATADAAGLALERLERLEPKLVAELQTLRTEAKQARWRLLLGQYQDASVSYAAALRVAIERMHVMLSLNTEARRLGYEHEVQASFIPPTRMISIEAVDIFEAALERARDAATPKPPPQARAAPPKAAAPPPAAQAAPPAPKPPRPAQAPPKPVFEPPAPDESGRVPIVFLKAGIELDGLPRPRVGDTVLLDAGQARQIVLAGVADYAERAA
jgi:hypothetical protein